MTASAECLTAAEYQRYPAECWIVAGYGKTYCVATESLSERIGLGVCAECSVADYGKTHLVCKCWTIAGKESLF